MATYTCGVMMETEVCCNCGITFGLPTDFQTNRRGDKKSFYCPNGHPQSYTRSEADRLRDELARANQRLDQKKAEADEMRNQRDRAERRRLATKGVVTRIKNRTVRGVCPCCEATFPDLEIHMKEHHPDYEGKDEEES
jgi:hypothetical protein